MSSAGFPDAPHRATHSEHAVTGTACHRCARCRERHDKHVGGACPNGGGRFKWPKRGAPSRPMASQSFSATEVGILERIVRAAQMDAKASDLAVLARNPAFGNVCRKIQTMKRRIAVVQGDALPRLVVREVEEEPGDG